MKILRLLLISIALLPISNLHAAERASDVVQVEKAFARAAIPGMSMSGAFMTFHNKGTHEHKLVSAKSSVARFVELHGHEMKDGMMRMRQMSHFHLPPKQNKALKPGGLHIMLMGLQEPMTEGSEITMDLMFDDGSHTQIKVPVKSISAGK